jgi:hypothetical protein
MNGSNASSLVVHAETVPHASLDLVSSPAVSWGLEERGGVYCVL